MIKGAVKGGVKRKAAIISISKGGEERERVLKNHFLTGEKN